MSEKKEDREREKENLCESMFLRESETLVDFNLERETDKTYRQANTQTKKSVFVREGEADSKCDIKREGDRE